MFQFEPEPLSVSELSRYLRKLLEDDTTLQDLWVRGEISNLSRPTSGHLYFTLKDEQASLRCVIWRSQATRLRASLQNGQRVEAHGAISLYERDGAYQFYVNSVRLSGEGLLYQEFVLLKARLEAEGLFDAERKRPLPTTPHRIGIVTSPTGAALQDMLNTLRQRNPLLHVIVAPCAVQGSEAPAQIVTALRRLNQLSPPVDVILVGRGGGSLEDLWAFNDESVVRAIAESRVPVISGVGHETDFTLSDFAADLRAPTPTGAAVLAAPERAELLEGLHSLEKRLRQITADALEHQQHRLDRLNLRLERLSPHRFIYNEQQRLDAQQQRLWRATLNTLNAHRSRLSGLHAHLNALNPWAVLQRGYALVTQSDGKIEPSAQQIAAGMLLNIRLAEGTLSALAQPADEEKR
jgi:exodeoxyribonuclease VII large subunit